MKWIAEQQQPRRLGGLSLIPGLLLGLIAVLGLAGCAGAGSRAETLSLPTAIPAEKLESNQPGDPDRARTDPNGEIQEVAELVAPQPEPKLAISDLSDESAPALGDNPGDEAPAPPIATGAADLQPDIDVSSLAVGPKVGYLAPDFSLQTLDGGEISLADLHGSPVLLNYWATWCPPCVQELPFFDTLQQEYESLGLRVIAINGIEQDAMDDVQSLVAETGLSYPILLDHGEQVWRDYQVQFMPTTFLIDSQGVIRAILLGSATEEAFREKVVNLLAGTL